MIGHKLITKQTGAAGRIWKAVGLGLSWQEGVVIAKKLGIKDQQAAADIFVNFYRLFKDRDATQIEINPLAETKDGAVLWYGLFPSGASLTLMLIPLRLNI